VISDVLVCTLLEVLGGGGGAGKGESFVFFSNKCLGPSKIPNTYCGKVIEKMGHEVNICMLEVITATDSIYELRILENPL